MSGEASKIERAKALKAVRDILPDAASSLHELRQLAGDPAVERAIEGLKQEDEFALLCRLMGTATHCVHLEQRPVIAGDSLPPDFLSRFLPGYGLLSDGPVPTRGFRCFVEVKSTVKDHLKIGGSLLSSLSVHLTRFKKRSESHREPVDLKVAVGDDLLEAPVFLLWLSLRSRLP